MHKHSFRQKIHILRGILKEYASYMNKFNDSKCYARGKYIVITFFVKGQNFYDLKRRIPKYDIDKIIKRYRSKLNYEINKYIKECMKNRVCYYTRNDIKFNNSVRFIPYRVLNVKFF